MSSFQRTALFVFFDAIERDLIDRTRSLTVTGNEQILTTEERMKAKSRLQRREDIVIDDTDDFTLLQGLDLGEKYSVIMRHKLQLDQAALLYFSRQQNAFEKAIPVRNAVMHGRPLTTIEFALGFALANDFLKHRSYWPHLYKTYHQYNENPQEFVIKSVSLLDEDPSGETLHNLPVPDYDDTGFLPRPDLEKELRRKILGRHPVITVLGEGGNGKTALTIQTLYGLIANNDHPFDAIVWISAKSARLGTSEIERVEGAINDSLGLLTEVARQFEPGEESPLVRVRRLLEENKVLLVIDNLETVLDQTLRDFAADVPGESKLVFTSRVPLGSDLSVYVGDFDEREARTYLRRLIEAYAIMPLSKKTNTHLDHYARRLNRKPLLLKWFALGVLSGLDPEVITMDIDLALKFCMENVIDQLSNDAKTVALGLAALPGAASAPLIQEVVNLPARAVEAAIGELLRSALIQRDDKAKMERLYQLGMFAKIYIIRVLKPDRNFSSEVLRRYRAIDAVFQNERGSQAFNRYDVRIFTVRNRSEALTSRKLKKVIALSNHDDLAGAEALLQEIKMVSSDYFEVHRVDALIAIKEQDIPRAAAAYDTALELADRQPQLHYFYAGLLSRYMADYHGAGLQLEQAWQIDPGTPNILQEAARNAFFAYDFTKAHDLMGRASKLPIKTRRDEIIFADLTTQLHTREAEYLGKSGDFEGAAQAIRALIASLSSMDIKLFDTKHVDHLRKIYRVIADLIRTPQFGEIGLLETLGDLVRGIENTVDASDFETAVSDLASSTDFKTGKLKPEGQSPYFGFLKDWAGEETYISRSSVSDFKWAKLCMGATAKYTVSVDGTGRTVVNNVSLL